jgi:hypothetical protein
MEQEIWKDCVGYEGLYQVSNLGRVRGLDRYVKRERYNKISEVSRKGGIMKPSICNGGMMLHFWKDGISSKPVKVHNLVLEAFVGERPKGYQACHFPDRSHENNRLDNLRWDTSANNQRDKLYHGTDNRGEKCCSAKITRDTALKIKKMLLNHGPKYVSDNLNVGISIVKNIKYNLAWSWLKV